MIENGFKKILNPVKMVDVIITMRLLKKALESYLITGNWPI